MAEFLEENLLLISHPKRLILTWFKHTIMSRWFKNKNKNIVCDFCQKIHLSITHWTLKAVRGCFCLSWWCCNGESFRCGPREEQKTWFWFQEANKVESVTDENNLQELNVTNFVCAGLEYNSCCGVTVSDKTVLYFSRQKSTKSNAETYKGSVVAVFCPNSCKSMFRMQLTTQRWEAFNQTDANQAKENTDCTNKTERQIDGG